MKGIYSGLYVRNDTSNLANFKSNSSLGHVIQGSELHCYKDGSTTPTIYFDCSLSHLTVGTTYYFLIKNVYNSSNPSYVLILNSSNTAITTLSTTLARSFTMTSAMDKIRVTYRPVKACGVTCMLTDTLSKVAQYVPYIQHVVQVANGENYVETVLKGANLLLYNYGTVLRYATVGKYKLSLNGTYGFTINAHNLNSDSTHYYAALLHTTTSFPGKIFSNSSYKVNWLVIPDNITSIDNSYKINNLNSTGDVYIHKDCNLLTYSEFMANFKGWNVWLYDSDYKDIVGHTDMTIGNYGYGS